MKDIVIVSPHQDDEIISCFEIIKTAPKNVFIVYNPTGEEIRKQEALKLKSEFSQIKSQFFMNEIPAALLDTNNTLYFPCKDDTHPAHIQAYFKGYDLWLNHGMDVVFYSTEMNVHYKHEVKDWIEKRKLLNHIYSSQSRLWEMEAKYYLFEARIKYMK